jgi:hypothetical protein
MKFSATLCCITASHRAMEKGVVNAITICDIDFASVL